MIDRFTWKTLEFMERVKANHTLQDFMDTMDPKFLYSEATARTDLYPRLLNQVSNPLFISEFRF